MYGEEEQQPQLMGTPYQNPLNNYGSSIILMTNPENELHNMALALRGVILDGEGKEVQTGMRLMNEHGINSIVSQTRALVSQVTVMSNLSKYEIPNLMEFIGDTIAKDLMLNRVKYGIVNPAARDKIFYIALSCAFVCMKRGFEEGDRRFWKGSTQEITTRVDGQQKQGVISKLIGWGK